MAHAIAITEKRTLSDFFCRDPDLHLYEIGDLDPFFWPMTEWFGLQADQELQACALLYGGASIPTMLLLERTHVDAAAALLEGLLPKLPAPLYAHLSPGLEKHLGAASVSSHGRFLKMSLRTPELVKSVATDGTEQLTSSHRQELARFYEQSYPENWFMPRMLETAQYFGLRADDSLAAVAGVHVYSAQYKVAALGNIATRPDLRGQGLGRKLTARLCQSLLRTAETIGLNVRADNSAAIRCYRSLGFEVVAEYNEFTVDQFGGRR